MSEEDGFGDHSFVLNTNGLDAFMVVTLSPQVIDYYGIRKDIYVRTVFAVVLLVLEYNLL